MNIGQIVDSAVAKTVRYCDQSIRRDPGNTKNIIRWLNDNIIYHLFEDTKYYNRIETDIIENLDDSTFHKKFVDNVIEQNLFIEGPCFSHIDMANLEKNLVKTNEKVLIKKDLIHYIKDKLKLKSDFIISSDTVRDDIFCGPMYVNKLFKLTKNTVNARDFGYVKDVTQQPVRGRAKGGGSRLGQMEIEGLLAAGCDKAIKEFLTVKSDRNEEKRKLVKEVIESGEFNINIDSEGGGQTKKVVSAILKFLKE